jgi:hypothetical protein
LLAAPIINRAPRKISTGGEQSDGREGKKENLTIAQQGRRAKNNLLWTRYSMSKLRGMWEKLTHIVVRVARQKIKLALGCRQKRHAHSCTHTKTYGSCHF